MVSFSQGNSGVCVNLNLDRFSNQKTEHEILLTDVWGIVNQANTERRQTLTVELELPGADGAGGRLPEEDDVLDSSVERLLPVQVQDLVRHVRQDRVVRSVCSGGGGQQRVSGMVGVNSMRKFTTRGHPY